MKNVADFIQLEEEARNLYANIRKLNDEAVNYKNSSEELRKAREELVSLIKRTSNMVDNSSKIITELRSIGMPELLQDLQRVQDAVSTSESNIKDNTKNIINQLKYIIIGGFALVSIFCIFILLK